MSFFLSKSKTFLRFLSDSALNILSIFRYIDKLLYIYIIDFFYKINRFFRIYKHQTKTPDKQYFFGFVHFKSYKNKVYKNFRVNKNKYFFYWINKRFFYNLTSFIKEKNMYYQDEYLYYFWKRQGLPTSYGKEISFLDLIDMELKNKNWSNLEIWEKLKQEFGKEKEYWLLNRLDNETGWLLYFAKTEEIWNNYKSLQEIWKIQKIYIADVKWNFKYENININNPIYHHRFDNEKMVVLKSEKDQNKIRGNAHELCTYVERLYYDEISNITTLKVVINKWIRHQIRVHLASIGYPIVGDKIYKKNAEPWNLHLRSIWLKID